MGSKTKGGSLRTAIQGMDENQVTEIIVGRHRKELSSPTRFEELKGQIGKGPMVHLMACEGCANAILAVARTASPPAPIFSEASELATA
jgi:hypothetical protein